MPGHKFGTIAHLSELNLAALDNTEVMGMDNLYEAQGIIKQAMDLMAYFYGAKESIFLTNGSTAGILASILVACDQGDQLIVARNAHHSVWSGMILSGAIPIYINPEYLEEEDLFGEVTATTVEEALLQYPQAKAVMIVSPTYEGIVSDIEEIAKVVHKHNKILIVDEAHGAHFVLDEAFPTSSVKMGADIVINSMHKTLPALTQSGLLHLCSNRIAYEVVIEKLRMIQTSSPSYMMMGIMDYMRCYILEHHKEIKEQYIDELLATRRRLDENLKALRLIAHNPKRYDVSKIIISTLNADINGYELSEELNRQYNIVVEAALDTYIILMTTMADHKETLTRLEKALIHIDSRINTLPRRTSINEWMTHNIVLGMSPRVIHYSKTSWTTLQSCKSKIAAKNIMLYPPGIPLVCMGETIEEKHIELISTYKDKLQGLKLVDGELLLCVL